MWCYFSIIAFVSDGVSEETFSYFVQLQESEQIIWRLPIDVHFLIPGTYA